MECTAIATYCSSNSFPQPFLSKPRVATWKSGIWRNRCPQLSGSRKEWHTEAIYTGMLYAIAASCHEIGSSTVLAWPLSPQVTSGTDSRPSPAAGFRTGFRSPSLRSSLAPGLLAADSVHGELIHLDGAMLYDPGVQGLTRRQANTVVAAER